MKMLALGLLLAASLVGKNKVEKTYPDHGQLIEVAGHPEARGGGVYTDADGGVHSNRARRFEIYVWTLRSSSMEYQIESTSQVRPIWMKRAKGPGEVADQVNFRIEKGKVYIQYGDKERRYKIVGKRLVDPK